MEGAEASAEVEGGSGGVSLDRMGQMTSRRKENWRKNNFLCKFSFLLGLNVNDWTKLSAAFISRFVLAVLLIRITSRVLFSLGKIFCPRGFPWPFFCFDILLCHLFRVVENNP